MYIERIENSKNQPFPAVMTFCLLACLFFLNSEKFFRIYPVQHGSGTRSPTVVPSSLTHSVILTFHEKNLITGITVWWCFFKYKPLPEFSNLISIFPLSHASWRLILWSLCTVNSARILLASPPKILFGNYICFLGFVKWHLKVALQSDFFFLSLFCLYNLLSSNLHYMLGINALNSCQCSEQLSNIELFFSSVFFSVSCS